MDINFHMPTKVMIGVGCIKQNTTSFKELGNKAMLVTGTTSAKLNGSQKDVIDALESIGISYILYDKVMSNPTIACVYEGAKLAKDNGVDLIISIGGGSPMDAGKAIALVAAQEIEEKDLFSGSYENKILPMVHIPTTAGTGSEVTHYSILTNDQAQTKTSIASPLLFPKIAFCDPSYMMTLGKTTTINTAVDALSHAVEGMLSIKASPLTDALAIESIKSIVRCYEGLKKGILTLEERENLLYASTLAGIVIAHTGTTAVHSMGYSLTYFKAIDHGRANGLLMANFFRFVERTNPIIIKNILSYMELEDIEAFESWMNQLLGYKDVITEDEIKQFSHIAIRAKNIANCKVIPTLKDLIEVYERTFINEQ